MSGWWCWLLGHGFTFTGFGRKKHTVMRCSSMSASTWRCVLPADAAAFRTSIDADWARLVTQIGPCGHEPKPTREPYEALVRAVAYQQLPVKAGDAILARMLALYSGSGFPLPKRLLDTDPQAMPACGRSEARRGGEGGVSRCMFRGARYHD